MIKDKDMADKIQRKKKQGLYIFIQGTAKERLQQQPVLHSEPQAEG